MNTTTRLHVYVGPMFAGKTSRIVWELEREAVIHAGTSLYITHSSDELRSSSADEIVTSHSAITASGSSSGRTTTLVIKRRLSSLKAEDLISDDIVAVGIDEGQFFNAEELVETVKRWMVVYSGSLKVIIVGGIDGDCEQNPFPHSGIPNLLPLSDRFEKLQTAVCLKCILSGIGPRQASFTIRKSNAPPGNIGGSERYEAVCRFCLQ